MEKMYWSLIQKWFYSTIASTTRKMIYSIKIMQMGMVYKFHHYLAV